MLLEPPTAQNNPISGDHSTSIHTELDDGVLLVHVVPLELVINLVAVLPLTPTAQKSPNCGDQAMPKKALSAPGFTPVQSMPLLLIAMRVVPLIATAQNNPNSGDQTTDLQLALGTPFVRSVHIVPLGLVMIPLAPTAQNISLSGDQQTSYHILVSATDDATLDHVNPSVLVMVRLPVPLDPTAQNIPNLEDQDTLSQATALFAASLNVQLTPSGLVITRFAPLFERDTNILFSGDQDVPTQILCWGIAYAVQFTPADSSIELELELELEEPETLDPFSVTFPEICTFPFSCTFPLKLILFEEIFRVELVSLIVPLLAPSHKESVPPIFTFFATAMPPATCNAPEVVELLFVDDGTLTLPFWSIVNKEV